MTDERALRERHAPYNVDKRVIVTDRCREDLQEWPCDARVLLDLLTAERERVEALREAVSEAVREADRISDLYPSQTLSWVKLSGLRKALHDDLERTAP